MTKRGFPPHGEGEATFSCSVVKYAKPILLVDPGKVSKIRGLVYPSPCEIHDVVCSSIVLYSKSVGVQLAVPYHESQVPILGMSLTEYQVFSQSSTNCKCTSDPWGARYPE